MFTATNYIMTIIRKLQLQFLAVYLLYNDSVKVVLTHAFVTELCKQYALQ